MHCSPVMYQRLEVAIFNHIQQFQCIVLGWSWMFEETQKMNRFAFFIILLTVLIDASQHVQAQGKECNLHCILSNTFAQRRN